MQASRRPRRAFAAPLVMTVAAIPACVVSQSDGPTTPPPHGGAAESRDHRGEGGDAPDVVANPPRPVAGDARVRSDVAVTERLELAEEPGDPAPSYERNWTVRIDAKGACLAYQDVQCPTGATCNPPPPQPVACPAGITVDRPVHIFAQAGSHDCYVMPAPVRCPERATCNPPPPRKTACPR
jgi:hypothetical protein